MFDEAILELEIDWRRVCFGPGQARVTRQWRGGELDCGEQASRWSMISLRSPGNQTDVIG